MSEHDVDGREGNLPVWAQRELRRLRATAEHWRGQATMLDNPDAPVTVHYGINKLAGFVRPVRVKFALPGGRWIECQMDAERELVHVRSSRRIVITPAAAVINAIAVEDRRYGE